MNKIKIYGGLGNQMFQYALCVAMKKKGQKTRISFSNFLYEIHHNGFNLGYAFKLKLSVPFRILSFLLIKFEFLYRNRLARSINRRLIEYYHKQFYKPYYEKQEFIYDSEVFQQKSKMLIGIWQVETYFSDIRSNIEEAYKFRMPTDRINIEKIKQITGCNSISIHIRKGDYESPHWKDKLGFINTTNFCYQAINYLLERIENPHFFIFSDDMDWVKQNFKISNCTYIDHNKLKMSYLDMYLMSLCKHNIIANSTFSWWGAWLNKNDSKIVVMPSRWIMTDYYPQGIFPEQWIKMGDEG